MHVRSGRCSECHARGSVCDIRVTKSKWNRLKSERERLLNKIELARRAQKEARLVVEEATRAIVSAFYAIEKTF